MTAKQILKQYFGYDSFREGQETLINSILSGKDTFGIMPTGAGKSICYQVPGIMMDGITLVITPLISLMKDQVASLKEAGIRGAYFNSSLTPGQYYKALQLAKQGTYKIIYVAPERLMNPEFLDFAHSVQISMITVDEAHCVSQWGQDFRPSYLKIIDFVNQLSYRPVLSAFTATATSQVKEDIIQILRLEDPTLLITGFDRQNLYFAVEKPGNKMDYVLNYLKKHPNTSGIIYCQTRKLVEEVTDQLNAAGFQATRYHAGLSDAERRQNQDDFVFDIKPIMVATNAFGMGIDKSNVHFVIHYNMPKDMESYYQEAGRAGRDGEKADCILLYSAKDVRINEFLINKESENDEMDQVQRDLIRERDRQKLKEMTFYCNTKYCLRNYMLAYFGERAPRYCGNCSVCQTQFEEQDVTQVARHIIGCVEEIGQRFGMKMVIDIVHGADNERIQHYNFDQLDYFGLQSHHSVHFLRQVMEHLLMENYLDQTNDKYSVIQLGDRAMSVLMREEKVIMKVPKEKPKESKKAKKAPVATGGNAALFEELRGLRMSIARKASVPPYVVFTDKTLREMSSQKPITKEEMLEISGVGETKYKKYGAKFMELIKKYR